MLLKLIIRHIIGISESQEHVGQKDPLEAEWSNLLLEAGPREQVVSTPSSHILNTSVDADFTSLGVPAANHPVALCWTWFSTSLFLNNKELKTCQCPRCGLTDTTGLGRITLLDMQAEFLPRALQLDFTSSCSTYCPPRLTGPFMKSFFLLSQSQVLLCCTGLFHF